MIFLPLRDSLCLLDLLNSTLHDGQLVQFLNFAICSSFSGVIGMSLDNMLLIRTCSRLRYEKKESMIFPSLQTQGSSLLYSGKEETVRQQKPLGMCLSINFVVFSASISPFLRKLSKSSKMANGTFSLLEMLVNC